MSSPVISIIKAPKRPWQDFLLHFFTFGIYSCFWFFSASRDLSRTSNQKLNPWLWWFVPFIFLAQLVALPAFVSAIETAEREHKINHWPGGANVLWIAGLLGLTFFFNLSNVIEFSTLLTFSLLSVWALFLSGMQTRLNRLKQSMENVQFKPIYAGYSIVEWVSIVLCAPIMAFVLWFVVDNQMTIMSQKPINAFSNITDKKQKIKLNIQHDGWSEVDVGTYSNGDADLEIKGPGESMYFVVFNHGSSESFDSLAQWRIGQAYDDFSSNNCRQNRTFVEDTLDIQVHVVCQGTELGDPSIQTVTLLSIDGEYFELFGYYSSTKNTFKEHKVNFINMSKGFAAYVD